MSELKKHFNTDHFIRALSAKYGFILPCLKALGCQIDQYTEGQDTTEIRGAIDVLHGLVSELEQKYPTASEIETALVKQPDEQNLKTLFEQARLGLKQIAHTLETFENREITESDIDELSRAFDTRDLSGDIEMLLEKIKNNAITQWNPKPIGKTHGDRGWRTAFAL